MKDENRKYLNYFPRNKDNLYHGIMQWAGDEEDCIKLLVQEKNGMRHGYKIKFNYK
jgi:hypothetical protein